MSRMHESGRCGMLLATKLGPWTQDRQEAPESDRSRLVVCPPTSLPTHANLLCLGKIQRPNWSAMTRQVWPVTTHPTRLDTCGLATAPASRSAPGTLRTQDSRLQVDRFGQLDRHRWTESQYAVNVVCSKAPGYPKTPDHHSLQLANGSFVIPVERNPCLEMFISWQVMSRGVPEQERALQTSC